MKLHASAPREGRSPAWAHGEPHRGPGVPAGQRGCGCRLCPTLGGRPARPRERRADTQCGADTRGSGERAARSAREHHRHGGEHGEHRARAPHSLTHAPELGEPVLSGGPAPGGLPLPAPARAARGALRCRSRGRDPRQGCPHPQTHRRHRAQRLQAPGQRSQSRRGRPRSQHPCPVPAVGWPPPASCQLGVCPRSPESKAHVPSLGHRPRD